MLRLTTHSSRCLEAFHCSSAMSGWWSIATWANGRHLVASRPDEVNCNVHETLALNNGSRHGDNPKTS